MTAALCVDLFPSRDSDPMLRPRLEAIVDFALG